MIKHTSQILHKSLAFGLAIAFAIVAAAPVAQAQSNMAGAAVIGAAVAASTVQKDSDQDSTRRSNTKVGYSIGMGYGGFNANTFYDRMRFTNMPGGISNEGFAFNASFFFFDPKSGWGANFQFNSVRNAQTQNNTFQAQSNLYDASMGVTYDILKNKYKLSIMPSAQLGITTQNLSIRRRTQGQGANYATDPMQSTNISHVNLTMGLGLIARYHIGNDFFIQGQGMAQSGAPTSWYSDNWASIDGIKSMRNDFFVTTLGVGWYMR